MAYGGVGDIRIGCSGWQYRHWRGSFYPADLPVSRWLEHYVHHFDTVEINNTFYRLPQAETFARWKARVPSHFTYAVKASRFLTHQKKLKDPEQPLSRLFDRASNLGRQLGPVLYQLPPQLGLDLDRLDHFLRALPRGRKHVIEVRNPRWYTEALYTRLARHGVALCVHDMVGAATGPLAVGPFAYLRLHGPKRYDGAYPEGALAKWSEWCSSQAAEGRSVFVYFNNDIGGHAPRDATRLRQMITGRTTLTL